MTSHLSDIGCWRVPKSDHVTITKIENLHIGHAEKNTDSKKAILIDVRRIITKLSRKNRFRTVTYSFICFYALTNFQAHLCMQSFMFYFLFAYHMFCTVTGAEACLCICLLVRHTNPTSWLPEFNTIILWVNVNFRPLLYTITKVLWCHVINNSVLRWIIMIWFYYYYFFCPPAQSRRRVN